MKPTPFLIVTMARSGSHHLRYVLNLHPQLYVRKELLNKTFESMPDAYLLSTAFRAPKRTPPIKAVGFKVLQEQLGPRPFTLSRLLEVPGLKVVVLERKSQLDRLRSEGQAHATQDWGVHHKPRAKPAVVLPPYHVDYWLRAAKAFYRQLREIPADRRHWIVYEEMMADQDAVMTPVWPFLGVPDPGPIRVETYRQEPRSPEQTVANIAELRDYFEGTEYESEIP